ncbi:MAG: hypothetical protein NC332_05675, partial [Firmicutes bacterium]|nr:hypothetical protein [Bacillota bacterium]
MSAMGFMGDSDITGNEDMATVLLEKLQGMGQFTRYVHSDYSLAKALLGASIGAVALNLLIAVAENALLLGIVVLMAMPFYHWILSTTAEGASSSAKRKVKTSDLQVRNNGVVKELIFTDIKRVVRDGQMGFQCILSLVVLPLMVAIFYFAFTMSGEDGENLIDLLFGEPLYQVIAPMVLIAYMSMLGMTSNVLGLYPISRENKSIYIIKSLPLSFNKYLLAKVTLATSAMLISDAVMCVLVVVLFKVHWYYGLLMLITMALLGFGAMCITTLIDLKSPKLGWTNFNQSLKNAKNSWLAMLVGIICLLAVAIIAVPCIVGYVNTNGTYMLIIMWALILGVAAGFAAVSYKIMIGKAERYFDNIEP